MRTFDEAKLTFALEHLSVPLRVAFAAACAERQMLAYRQFQARHGRDPRNALERALDDVWRDPGLVQEREQFEQRIEELMPLIPQQEGVQQSWTQEATNAQNAGMCTVYALRAKLRGEAQEAAWAARVAYEGLDNVAINAENIDTNTPGEEHRVLSHPLVQAELARQQRDIDELLAGKQDPAKLIARLRQRAREEAVGFFGPGPHATR